MTGAAPPRGRGAPTRAAPRSGLGGPAGAGTEALDEHDDHGRLGHEGVLEGLDHERPAGTGGRRHGLRAALRGADAVAERGDLIRRAEGHVPAPLEPERHLAVDLRGGRDRIAAEEAAAGAQGALGHHLVAGPERQTGRRGFRADVGGHRDLLPPGPQSRVWTKRPLRSFGSNHGLLGGMIAPPSAPASSWSTVVGYIATARAISPESTRCSSSFAPRMPPTKSTRRSVRGWPMASTGPRLRAGTGGATR